MRRFDFNFRSASKGQSFVELSLVVLLLMLLLAGIAEFGVLLNRYLNLMDGAREAARFNSNYNPFCPEDSTDPGCPAGTITPDYFKSTACEALQVIKPIQMESSKGDDVVVSFFTVEGGTITGRYPVADGENGWSWAENGDFIDENPNCDIEGTGTRNANSKQTIADVQARLDPTAPDVSVSLVEIFYNYPQTLRAPFYEQFFPDPIPVYTYAVMPIKNVTPPSSP